MHFPSDFILPVPTMPSNTQRGVSSAVALHARGGGQPVTCEDVKASIMKRRGNLEKDLNNLKKHDQIDKGHSKELDQKMAALQKDFDRWDRLGCGPDPEVDKCQEEIYEAKEILNEKTVVKMVNVSDQTEVNMTILEVAKLLGISVLVAAVLFVLLPATLEAMLLRIGFAVVSLGPPAIAPWNTLDPQRIADCQTPRLYGSRIAMQTLKKGASFFSERLTRGRSTSEALSTPGGTESRQAGQKAFVSNCSSQEAHCRKLLVHQEAVAGVVDRYLSAMLFAFEDLAVAHEQLLTGLQQAVDLVDLQWLHHVEALAGGLREGAEENRQAVQGIIQDLQLLRGKHKEAVRLASEAEVAASRRSHYEVKVERLRQEVQKAREGLGTAALAPERASSSGILSKSLNQRRTNNYDLKQGQLCRNEEKLTRMTEVEREAHALSLRSLLKLQHLVEQILRSCIDGLLPSIHAKHCWAQQKAPPPRSDSDGYGTGTKGRQRTLEDATEDGTLNVGDIVSVQGLNSQAHYNGENGTVKNIRPDNRIEVELVLEGVPGAEGTDENNKILAVKPENLRRVCPAQLPSQCSGLLVQGAEALVLEDWDPRNVVRTHEDSDDTLADGRRASVC
eukprot:s4751_g1.t2